MNTLEALSPPVPRTSQGQPPKQEEPGPHHLESSRQPPPRYHHCPTKEAGAPGGRALFSRCPQLQQPSPLTPTHYIAQGGSRRHPAPEARPHRPSEEDSLLHEDFRWPKAREGGPEAPKHPASPLQSRSNLSTSGVGGTPASAGAGLTTSAGPLATLGQLGTSSGAVSQLSKTPRKPKDSCLERGVEPEVRTLGRPTRQQVCWGLSVGHPRLVQEQRTRDPGCYLESQQLTGQPWAPGLHTVPTI